MEMERRKAILAVHESITTNYDYMKAKGREKCERKIIIRWETGIEHWADKSG